MSPRRRRLLTLVLLALGLVLVVGTAWERMQPDGRDYASFHYAVQVWLEGGDPYDAAALTAAAHDEGTRPGGVYPFFYPPTALPLLAWTALFDLETGYRAMVILGWLALVLSARVVHGWIGAPAWLLAALFATYGPLVDTARLGQVNLLVLLALLLGVAPLGRSRQPEEPDGGGLAAAILVKMSPVLLALPWLLRRQRRPLQGLLLAGGGLVILSLLLVPLPHHQTFWAEVLPAFSTGAPEDLGVKVQFFANHSWLALYDRFLPGPDAHHLSEAALWLGRLTTLALLLPPLLLARRRRDALGEAALVGALCVVLTYTPAFAFEHHLVFLLPALAALGTGLLQGRLPRWTWAPALLVYLALAVPQPELRRAWRAAPALWPLLVDLKTLAGLGLWALCLDLLRRSPALRPARPAPGAPPPRADP